MEIVLILPKRVTKNKFLILSIFWEIQLIRGQVLRSAIPSCLRTQGQPNKGKLEDCPAQYPLSNNRLDWMLRRELPMGHLLPSVLESFLCHRYHPDNED